MTGKRVRKAFWGNNDQNLPNMIKLPGGSVVKNLPTNPGEIGLIPGSGRSRGEGNGIPLWYSCLRNPMDGGAWWVVVHGVTRVSHDLATKQWQHFILQNFFYLDELYPHSSVNLFLDAFGSWSLYWKVQVQELKAMTVLATRSLAWEEVTSHLVKSLNCTYASEYYLWPCR